MPTCWANGWIKIYTSPDYVVYYGEKSLGFLNNNPESDVVCIWLKYDYSDNYAKNHNKTPDGDTYAKTITRDYMFNMNRKNVAEWKKNEYDKNGNLIRRCEMRNNKAIPIESDEMKAVYVIVEKYYQQYRKR